MAGLAFSIPARLRAAGAAIVLVGAGLAAIGASAAPARGDTAPPAGTPATVSADALPTVQVNGVVWSMVTVGNAVYVAGRFSQTWPAGQKQTAKNTTVRANLLEFDIRTGRLVTTFNHRLNAQGLVVTASPDGKRIYVGGQFTAVDGQARHHIAAFDTATGALVPAFRPSMNSNVQAITATNTEVYAGGTFTSVNGVTRSRLAAIDARSGALSAWPAKADSTVTALVMTPDHTGVVAGGRFSTLNATTVYGLGELDARLGTTKPFAANAKIRDYGAKAAILSLSADASSVYATGYAFGGGNFEGTARLEPDTGKIVWVDDCHGDTYGTRAIGAVLYSVGHAHDCSAMHSFPDTTTPRVSHRALAETLTPAGTVHWLDDYGWNYIGTPYSSLLQWFPTLNVGTFTGQSQAAWAVTGNARYVALGGEFPTVNGVAQHGLTRFALRPVAPNKVGPIKSAALTPRVTSFLGLTRVRWSETWDEDNQTLTYQVFRDGALVKTMPPKDSSFWQMSGLSFADSTVTRGSHTYVVRAIDPLGNATSSAATTVTVP
jgi:trimeric autotransporter adhesin